MQTKRVNDFFADQIYKQVCNWGLDSLYQFPAGKMFFSHEEVALLVVPHRQWYGKLRRECMKETSEWHTEGDIVIGDGKSS